MQGDNRGGTRWQVALAAPVSAAACFPLLLVVVLVASTFATGGGLPVPTGRAPLDYQRGLREFPPLDAGFIRAQLGGVVGLTDGRSRAESVRTTTHALPALQQRTIVDHTLTNDTIAGALPITSVPFTGRTNTENATRTAEDPTDCSAAGPTVWYRYEPSRDLTLLASTFGSDHGVALGVFEWSTSGLRQMNCDVDVSGNAATTFVARAHTAYLFQLSGVAGGGNLVLNLDIDGVIRRASTGWRGQTADWPSNHPAVSRDGRYVAFTSSASNFVEGDQPEDRPCPFYGPVAGGAAPPCGHIWVRDMRTGAPELISVSSSGEPANQDALDAYLSADGRFVVFHSLATNLAPGDPRGADIFVRDRRTGRTERLPRPASGPDDIDPRMYPTITDDGRYVAFQTPQPLIAADDNGTWDVYVHDRWSGRFELATVSSEGEQAAIGGVETAPVYNAFLAPYISGDGRFVVFHTDAPNLVPGDTNRVTDVFVRDRLARITERVSVSSAGEQANDGTGPAADTGPSISRDGRYVVFASYASNLTEKDESRGYQDLFVRDRALGTTQRLTDDSGQVVDPTISEDGRYIAWDQFPSHSGQVGPSAVAPGDESARIYRLDTWSGTNLLVTRGQGSAEGWGWYPQISGDGRHVVFSSTSDTYAGPTNGLLNVFLYSVGS